MGRAASVRMRTISNLRRRSSPATAGQESSSRIFLFKVNSRNRKFAFLVNLSSILSISWISNVKNVQIMRTVLVMILCKQIRDSGKPIITQIPFMNVKIGKIIAWVD